MSVGTIKQTACLYETKEKELCGIGITFLDLKKENLLRLKIYLMNNKNFKHLLVYRNEQYFSPGGPVH